MPWLRSVGAAAVTATLLAGLSACSAGPERTDAFSGPYGPQVKAAYESATDPAVKATLADGKITQAEYDAAVQRAVKCAADQGVTVTPEKLPGGLYQYSLISSPNGDAVFTSCGDSTLTSIEVLYSQVLENPQNRDMNEVYADCLKRAGIVPRDYTGQQYLADAKAGSGPFAGTTLDPDVQQCMLNPQSGSQASTGAGG